MDDFGSQSSDDMMQEWSVEKLSLLEKYLHAYSTIMNSQREKGRLREHVYVDAFSYRGQHLDPETREFVSGSPIRALECDPPFDRFHFIELDEDRLERLQALVQSRFPYHQVRYHRGDANQVLRDDIVPDVRYEDFKRGVVFLDPYGLTIDFQTVETLARARSFDVFINFSIMGVNRLLDRNQLPDEKKRDTLARVMGDAKWIDDLYKEETDLLGELRSWRSLLPAEKVALLYAERLRRVFEYVSKPRIMPNSKNSPLYALFVASHKEAAKRIADGIFGGYRQLSQRRYK